MDIKIVLEKHAKWLRGADGGVGYKEEIDSMGYGLRGNEVK